MSYPLFPDLSPNFAELLRLVNVDQPVDEDEELTKLENEHAAWKEKIARHNSNFVPIGVEPGQPRREEELLALIEAREQYTRYTGTSYSDDEEEEEVEEAEDVEEEEEMEMEDSVDDAVSSESGAGSSELLHELLHQSDEEATTKPMRI